MRRYSPVVDKQSLRTVQKYCNVYGRVMGWGGSREPPPPPTLPYILLYIGEYFMNFFSELLVNIASVCESRWKHLYSVAVCKSVALDVKENKYLQTFLYRSHEDDNGAVFAKVPHKSISKQLQMSESTLYHNLTDSDHPRGLLKSMLKRWEEPIQCESMYLHQLNLSAALCSGESNLAPAFCSGESNLSAV
jgi:hypothetical protein